MFCSFPKLPQTGSFFLKSNLASENKSETPNLGGVAMKNSSPLVASSRVTGAAKAISFALLLMALFALTAFGQQTTTGNLNLTVVDPSQAVVAGATVTITNMETGAVRTGTSNTSGVVEIANLNPANYSVTVEAKGFKKSVSHDIIVSVS